MFFTETWMGKEPQKRLQTHNRVMSMCVALFFAKQKRCSRKNTNTERDTWVNFVPKNKKKTKDCMQRKGYLQQTDHKLR